MEKVLELDDDEGFNVVHLSRRIQGLEDAIVEASKSLRSARESLANEVRKVVLGRGEVGDEWALEAKRDGTATLRLRTANESPAKKPRGAKKRA